CHPLRYKLIARPLQPITCNLHNFHYLPKLRYRKRKFSRRMIFAGTKKPLSTGDGKRLMI
ncbi:MAG: hypothetical protein ABJN80_09400, partial [Luteolibacter sp.]